MGDEITNQDQDTRNIDYGNALETLIIRNQSTPIDVVDVNLIVKWMDEAWHIVSNVCDVEDGSLPPFLSPKFLDISRRGAREVAAATLRLDVRQEDGVSFRTKAIAAAARQGFVTALSPFSGEPQQVFHTIGCGWSVILSAAGCLCLASNMGAPMVDVHLETVWVFPTERLVLCTTLMLSRDQIKREIAKFFLNVLTNQLEVLTYLGRDLPDGGDGVSVCDFECPHMSHNLWNIQTAWFNLFELVSPSRFKTIVNYANQNFFGALNDLYPDAMAGASSVHFVESERALFLRCLRSGGVMISVKDEMFRPGFGELLVKQAKSQCSSEFLASVAALCAACKPLLVTTIRLDNREWIEQREGLPLLFGALREDFPKLGVIIDGLSSDTAKGWTTGWMSLENELKVARFIQANVGNDLHVELAVGRTFAESIVLCDAADCFVAPSGSGMALYKWICNKPGLAFSNTIVLNQRDARGWPLRVWHDPRFRHDVTPTVHISPDLVRDDTVARNQETRSNFNLDWRVLYDEVKAFLKSLDLSVEAAK